MLENNSKEKPPLRVAILGSGNIGCDILLKTLASTKLLCQQFIGRRENSSGIAFAKKLGINISYDGIHAITKNPLQYDLVFDASSASSHLEHYTLLKRFNIKVINLTPAPVGGYCFPTINLSDCIDYDNIHLVTCGGQAAIPLCYALSKMASIDYLEVVSSIAAKSAGLATRHNINEYLCTTEDALQHFTGCPAVKVILNINPAEPCINMKTTIYAKIKNPDMLSISQEIAAMVKKINSYVPGYTLLSAPMYDEENQRLILMLEVTGLGDFLPKYAGNLDIITCTAIKVAEAIADKRTQ